MKQLCEAFVYLTQFMSEILCTLCTPILKHSLGDLIAQIYTQLTKTIFFTRVYRIRFKL